MLIWRQYCNLRWKNFVFSVVFVFGLTYLKVQNKRKSYTKTVAARYYFCRYFSTSSSSSFPSKCERNIQGRRKLQLVKTKRVSKCVGAHYFSSRSLCQRNQSRIVFRSALLLGSPLGMCFASSTCDRSLSCLLAVCWRTADEQTPTKTTDDVGEQSSSVVHLRLGLLRFNCDKLRQTSCDKKEPFSWQTSDHRFTKH